jgi:hypothetical protein
MRFTIKLLVILLISVYLFLYSDFKMQERKNRDNYNEDSKRLNSYIKAHNLERYGFRYETESNSSAQ